MNSANRNYQEKRNFIRMKVETPISIKLGQDIHLQGICHDLSGGGMLISLAETLLPGAEVEVTVSSNHGHNPMLRALTKVSRVQNRKSQPSYVGLEIMALLD